MFLETQIVRHAMDKCLDGYVPVPMQSFDYAFHKYKWTCGVLPLRGRWLEAPDERDRASVAPRCAIARER